MANKVVITHLQGRNNIAASRPTINQNFQLLADALNTLMTYLDPATQQIAGIRSINVTSSDQPVTDTLITTNGSINAGGNIIANRLIQAKNAIIENDVTINKGSLIMNSENSRLDCAGKFILGGEFIMSDFGSSSIINASYIQTWETSNSSNLIIQTQTGAYAKKDPSISGTIVGGLLSAVGRSGIIIDWGLYGSDPQHILDVVMIDTAGISAGHTLKIIAKLGNNSGGHTFKIAPETIAYPAGQVLKGINFTTTYDTVELIFDGVNWVPINLKGAILDYTS